jgi:hypothetical protein
MGRRLHRQSTSVRRDNSLHNLKAGPAGGRLRRPSSRRQQHDGHRGTGLPSLQVVPKLSAGAARAEVATARTKS